MEQLEGKKRVVIEHVKPEINCGRFPAKRVVGEEVTVTADIFGDGHDEVKAQVLYRNTNTDSEDWAAVPMEFLGNDRWQATFTPEAMGRYEYTVEGWVDHFYTWQKGLKKKFEANQDVTVELQIGAQKLEETAAKAGGQQQEQLYSIAHQLRHNPNHADAVALATSADTSEQMRASAERENVTIYDKRLQLDVERQKALFSAWYEFFPRSAAPIAHGEPGSPGCEDGLLFLPFLKACPMGWMGGR